jgi:hypothetical protein
MNMSRQLFAIAFLLSAAAASADPVTFSFTGAVDNDPFGVFGAAAFTGSYTFASNTPQVLNTAQSGGYTGAGGVFAMTVSFTGTIGGALDGMPFSANTVNITVNRNLPGPLDEYLLTGTSSTDSNLSIELTLDDNTGTAFSNTSLPLSPPNLANFSSRRFALFDGSPDNPVEAEGALTTLTCASGCATAAPEPSYTTLLAAAISAMVWIGRRRSPNKQRRKQMKRFDQLAVVALALGLPLSSLAVDGVVLIDQNKAMAGNVTPGDTPGFPISITQSGSYRLAGNLTVPVGTNGIEISASNVFLDLNGFTISCGGGTQTLRVACIIGIAPVHDISIRNGAISQNAPSSNGFTFNGIFFSNAGFPNPIGERISLQDLMIDATDPLVDGVVLGPGCIVRHNIIHHPYIFGSSIVLENIFKAGSFLLPNGPDPSNIVIP